MSLEKGEACILLFKLVIGHKRLTHGHNLMITGGIVRMRMKIIMTSCDILDFAIGERLDM
jgi:hypothetical protein